MCGASKRVTANNFIYYIYILGEVVVVLFAYLIRDYRQLYAAFTLLMTLFLFYFWYVPESPRWSMAKNLNNEAYKVFKRIAKSNKKSEDSLVLLESIKEHKINSVNNRRLRSNRDSLPMKVLSVSPTNNEQNQKFDSSNNDYEKSAANVNKNNENSKAVNPISFVETFKLFFKSKKLLIRSCILLLNWLTNTLVYYGISFNTTELIGDPYLNFFLSIVVEFVAILACQFTLERFGRKIPYSINMALAGAALLCVQFTPESNVLISFFKARLMKFLTFFLFLI
jgi:MFS transporter, OCT family, solute carrier family 22 (organic cation transporter), member 4/5